jgi:predicted MFS family arabinose efflux permease
MRQASALYRYYALAAITAVYTLNIVDRQAIILLLEPIKHDLHLTDTQLGFLTGIAFGIFYATVGVPIARWADRGNRAAITSLAIGMWGLTVMACTLVSSYSQLVLARMGAAIGESGAKPPTYSLVGDYFPEPTARTRAMTIYLMSTPLSALITFPLCGWLNELYGWRMTFFFMGVPGLLLAILVRFTVIDPRTAPATAANPVHKNSSMRQVLGTLWKQRSCRHMTLAIIALYATGLGLSPWYGAYLSRSHAMQTRELGNWFGAIFSIGGMVGVLVGGYLCNRVFAGNERGQMRMTALATGLLVPCFSAFLLLPQRTGALISLGVVMVTLSIYLAPTYVLLQRLVSEQMRATVLALVMLLANLIGMGMGPQIVGVLSDLLAPSYGTHSLRYAMLVVSFGAWWSAFHFWRVSMTVQQDLNARSIATSRPEDMRAAVNSCRSPLYRDHGGGTARRSRC